MKKFFLLMPFFLFLFASASCTKADVANVDVDWTVINVTYLGPISRIFNVPGVGNVTIDCYPRMGSTLNTSGYSCVYTYPWGITQEEIFIGLPLEWVPESKADVVDKISFLAMQALAQEWEIRFYVIIVIFILVVGIVYLLWKYGPRMRVRIK